MIDLSAPSAQRILKVLGILELLLGLLILWPLIKAYQDVWIGNDEFPQQEWTPLFIDMMTPLVTLLLISALAAFRRWRRARVWQIFGVGSLLLFISLMILGLTTT